MAYSDHVTWSYRPSLDGLRTVAVYLVLVFHTGMSVMSGGFIGVDLFFVLSGFLVTNVILSEIDRTGRLSLGGFYARRVRRLLPAALVVVVATSLVYMLVFPVTSRMNLVGDARSALLYFANWNFLFQQNDYFAEGVDESPFLHFWSLAIEEQYYVVFPVLLLLLTRWARRWTGAVIAGLLLLSLGSQLYWAQTDMNWAYYGTDARLYQLLAGALLAVAFRTYSRRPSTGTAGAIAFVGLAALLFLGTGFVDVTPSVRGIAATVASVLVIGGLMTAPDGAVGRTLSHPLPVYLGKISYGTYLWHWPVILVLDHFLAARPLVIAAMAAVLSTSLAALSFNVLEHPIRTAALLKRFNWSVVVVGVSTGALLAVAVVPPVLESNRRPRLADQAMGASDASPVAGAVGSGVSAKDLDKPVPANIDWASAQEGGEEYPLCSKADPDACTIVEGDGPHVLLVGDSYGRMFTSMFADLAEEHGFKLSHNAIPACPWQSDLVLNRLSESRLETCLTHRKDWYDEVLPEMDVDLVVLTALDRDTDPAEDPAAGAGGDGKLSRVGGSRESIPELVYSTSEETIEQITDKGPRVLIFESLPVPHKGDPLECLGTATRLSQCAMTLPDEEPVSDAMYRTLASVSDDVYSLDLKPVFCPGAPVCLPVVDRTVVWSNAMHLSIAYTVKRKKQVWNAIERSGALDGLLGDGA